MEDRAMSHSKATEAMVAEQPIEDWACIPLRKLERKVYRLQKRIYQASDRGNDKAVHNLQRLLMKSQAARTLAVRKVTQDNQGKRTAGIDGVKSVEPAQRFIMVQRLRHHKTIKPQPTRRVWIPKPGKAEKRPLGILTMLDRDIANCFNTINHSVLLEKLHTFPAMRRVIKAWLKAGVLEEGVFTPTV